MVSRYPLIKISNLAQKIGMGPFGSSIKVETFKEIGVPIINGQHLRGSKLLDKGFNYISESHAMRLLNANVGCGDVVFTHRGNIGQVSYIPKNSEYKKYIVSQSQFFIRPIPSVVSPEYLTYYFISPEGQTKLRANLSQTGVPAMAQPTTYVKSLEIPLPSLEIQKAITNILGSLDEKIELNTKVNEKLEGIAQALFKSWFIDFDPAKAKAEGRDTGLPEHISSLFPASFVDSELGQIPEGWNISVLGHLCAIPQYGYTASAEVESVGPRFLRITDINKSPWIEWESVPYCTINDEERDKYLLELGDILIARMADPGHGVVVEEDIDAVFASYLIRFRPLKQEYSRYIQYWLRSDQYWRIIEARKTGTTRASINAKEMGRFPLIIPNMAALKLFSSIIDKLRGAGNQNIRINATLGKLRNTLLPKLISGELPIPDAERIVGRCL